MERRKEGGGKKTKVALLIMATQRPRGQRSCTRDAVAALVSLFVCLFLRRVSVHVFVICVCLCDAWVCMLSVSEFRPVSCI